MLRNFVYKYLVVNEYLIISDQRSVYWRHHPLQDKMLGSRYGRVETNTNDTPIKVVPVSHRYFINEWEWLSKWNPENAHKNMWIFSKSVSYNFFNSLYVCYFELSISFYCSPKFLLSKKYCSKMSFSVSKFLCSFFH